MLRLLVVLLLLAAPAVAQPSEEPPPERLPTVEDQAVAVARDFIRALIAGDARGAMGFIAVPFHLEGARVTDENALFSTWLRVVREKRTDLLTLYGVEVFSPEAMEKKYGKPPARLQALPWRGPKTWIAVANVSGRAAVLVLKEYAPMDLRVIAFTD
jgi:hypothetical protein